MKIIGWFRESNRWKHLVGGFAVGLFGGSWWSALYAGAVAASCLELKDKFYSGDWDWIDWSLTLAGAAVSAILWGVG